MTTKANKTITLYKKIKVVKIPHMFWTLITKPAKKSHIRSISSSHFPLLPFFIITSAVSKTHARKAIVLLRHHKLVMAYITYCFLVLSMLSLCLSRASSDGAIYANSLLKFKASLTNTTMLNDWQEPVDALCSLTKSTWTGCLCSNGSFIGLRLDNMGLGGELDIDALSNLPIISLSVMNNNITGQFPSDLNKLGKLRSLNLANNSFYGEINDEAFSGMKAMRRVVLGYNFFTGKIPVSLLGLPKLIDLQLQNNQFEGRIPNFWRPDLVVNFANNKLEGEIPFSLRNQKASSFLGNINLCGKPLDPCKLNKSLKKSAV